MKKKFPLIICTVGLIMNVRKCEDELSYPWERSQVAKMEEGQVGVPEGALVVDLELSEYLVYFPENNT